MLGRHEIIIITPSSEISTRYLLEEVDRVRIVRLKVPKIKDIGYFRRAVSEFLMPFIMIRSLKKKTLIGSNLDGIITYAPSIFFGPLTNMLKIENKCKSYLILRDIFPQWAVDLGLIKSYGLPYYFFKRVERYLYSTADFIGVQTPANLKYFNENEVNVKGHVEVLQNWLARASPKSVP